MLTRRMLEKRSERRRLTSLRLWKRWGNVCSWKISTKRRTTRRAWRRLSMIRSDSSGRRRRRDYMSWLRWSARRSGRTWIKKRGLFASLSWTTSSERLQIMALRPLKSFGLKCTCLLRTALSRLKIKMQRSNLKVGVEWLGQDQAATQAKIMKLFHRQTLPRIPWIIRTSFRVI